MTTTMTKPHLSYANESLPIGCIKGWQCHGIAFNSELRGISCPWNGYGDTPAEAYRNYMIGPPWYKYEAEK